MKLMKINKLLGIFVIFGFLSLVAYKAYSIRNHEVPLEDQSWSSNPSLLALNYTSSTPTDSALIIYRMTDGTPQPVSGTWKYAFTSHSNIFFFGGFPTDTSTQRLYLLTERGGTQKDASTLPGPILNISENPKETYLLISGIDQRNISTSTTSTPSVSLYNCVGEAMTPAPDPCRMVLGDILPNYDTTTLYHSFWNMKNDRELIIEELGGKHRLFAFDPWEDHAVEIKPEERTDIDSGQQTLVSNYKLHRFLNMLMIEKSPHDKQFYFVPRGSTFSWLDQRHLMVRKNKTLYMLDTQTRMTTHMPDLLGDNTTIATYYSPQEL